MNSKLQEAANAVKAGDNQVARRLLLEVLREEPRNEAAWLVLASAVTDPQKKLQSLEMVLKINPDNKIAQKQLACLRDEPGGGTGKTGAQKQISELPEGSSSVSFLTVAIGSGILFTVIAFAVIGVIVFLLRGERNGRELADLSREEEVALPISTEPNPVEVGLPSTNTPIPSVAAADDPQVSCQAKTLVYMHEIEPLYTEFHDTADVVNSTARIALGPAIQDLQSIRREIQRVPVPTCAAPASDMLISGLDNLINSFLAFMGNEGDATIERMLRQSSLQM